MYDIHGAKLFRANLLELVARVVGGDFVGFSERWVVEDVVDEEIDLRSEGHGDLTDVNEFRGSRTDHVDADDSASFCVND